MPPKPKSKAKKKGSKVDKAGSSNGTQLQIVKETREIKLERVSTCLARCEELQQQILVRKTELKELQSMYDGEMAAAFDVNYEVIHGIERHKMEPAQVGSIDGVETELQGPHIGEGLEAAV